MNNKVAIITGASKGIGYGIAEHLASEGVKVYLVARKLDKLEEARDKINEKSSDRANIFQGDITNFDSIKSIIDNVYDTEGRLDIFVNNAGGYQPLTFKDDFNDIDKMIDLDMIAPFRIVHYLAQKFSEEKNNHLRILNVLSQAALQVFTGGSGYGVAKMGLLAGLLHIEKDLQAMGIDNIGIYRLYPGTVGTEGVIELVKQGVLENPTSLDSVISASMDLLNDNTLSRDVRVGYFPGEGIKRIYLESDLDKFKMLEEVKEEIVDSNYKPEDIL